MRIRKEEEQDIKNIDKKFDVNLPSPIAQAKNLLLKLDENALSKKEFADESESDNEDSFYEVEKNEMDIKISKDYLQNFSDRIEDTDWLFKDF